MYSGMEWVVVQYRTGSCHALDGRTNIERQFFLINISIIVARVKLNCNNETSVVKRGVGLGKGYDLTVPWSDNSKSIKRIKQK